MPGSWMLAIGNPTSPWRPHIAQIPLGGVRQHRRSQSRGEQTNTLYSIITTVRIIVSRGSAEQGPAMSHPQNGPRWGRRCPSAKILFLQDNRHRDPSLTQHYKGDPERWRPSAGCAGAPPAPGTPGPLGRRQGSCFLREVWFIFIIYYYYHYYYYYYSLCLE